MSDANEQAAAGPAPMTDEEHAMISNPAGFNEGAVLAPPAPEQRRTRPLPRHLHQQRATG